MKFDPQFELSRHPNVPHWLGITDVSIIIEHLLMYLFQRAKKNFRDTQKGVIGAKENKGWKTAFTEENTQIYAEHNIGHNDAILSLKLQMLSVTMLENSFGIILTHRPDWCWR